MGRNVNMGGSSSELLRKYIQVKKTPFGESPSITASFDPLTFGSITSESIYANSPNAFLSASLNSSLTSHTINDISASSLRDIIEPYSSSIKGGIPERIIPYTSSIYAKESKYVDWDTNNEIFY